MSNSPLVPLPHCTMRQVAQALGIASSTVSRALRDDPRIGAALREKVRRTAEELGYRPNPLISALMANRRKRGHPKEAEVIAFVTNYRGDEDWRKKEVCRWEFEGVRQRAQSLGFRLEVFSLSDYQDNPHKLATTLKARGIRGVLLGFSREDDQPALFDTAHFAIAGLSAYFRSTIVDRANFHGFFNVQLALDQMLQLGYHRPALIVPELNNIISNNLWSGAFLDWQRRLDHSQRCELFVPTGPVDLPTFRQWLEKNQPDALLVYKVPVTGFLAKLNYRLPDDLGLAYLYRTASEMGSTAGIDGNLAAVGSAALDLVVEKLNTNRFGLSAHPKEVLIKGTWHAGETLPRRLATTSAKLKWPDPAVKPTKVDRLSRRCVRKLSPGR